MRGALIIVAAVAVVSFIAGALVRDVEASSVGGGVNLSSYSGSVGISGAVAITGPSGITGLTINMASNGYALSLVPDTTSPTNAALFMARQDTNPTTAALGAVFLYGNGSTQVLRMASNTSTRYDDVMAVGSTSLTNTAFAGGGQGSATIVCDQEPLTELSTVASAGDSARLPTSEILGKMCHVWNKGANSANLFVPSGGTMCTGGTCTLNGSAAIPVNRGVFCWHRGSNNWNCSVLD